MTGKNDLWYRLGKEGVPHASLAGGEWASGPEELGRLWPSECTLSRFFQLCVCVCSCVCVCPSVDAHFWRQLEVGFGNTSLVTVFFKTDSPPASVLSISGWLTANQRDPVSTLPG